MDLGHDRISFLMANENSGEIEYWADIDKSSLTVTFHDLAGGAGQVVSVVEKAGDR